MFSEFFSTIGAYWDWLATAIKPYHDEILALATVFLALYTGFLAIISRQQRKDTKILQRAYLTIRAAGIHMLRNRNEAVAHIEICNAGNLPATEVKWFIKHDFSWKGDWRIDGIDARLVEGSGNVLAPHAKMRQGGDSIAVGLYLYIWGAVTYRDGFSRKRKTTFCHRYNCVNVTHNLQWGFPAMSGITARDHQDGNSAT